MSNHFFGMISRMKYINRWGLMKSSQKENLSEHALETAIIAHALAVIENTRFGGKIDENRIAVLALYHDTSEILTGDLPTPIKYYNPKIKSAYKEIENISREKLLSYLPDDLKPKYKDILFYESNEDNNKVKDIIKAADKISALIKCIEEEKSGNREFLKAYEMLFNTIQSFDMPCVKVFLEEFLPSYRLTLDEQK